MLLIIKDAFTVHASLVCNDPCPAVVLASVTDIHLFSVYVMVSRKRSFTTGEVVRLFNNPLALAAE